MDPPSHSTKTAKARIDPGDRIGLGRSSVGTPDAENTTLANSQMNHRHVVGGPRNASAVAGVAIPLLRPSIRTSAYLAHRHIEQAQPRGEGSDMSWTVSATYDSPPGKIESFERLIITRKTDPSKPNRTGNSVSQHRRSNCWKIHDACHAKARWSGPSTTSTAP
jgi:hypothetical protein